MGYIAELAVKHGSDRWGHHYYCEFYERYFEKFKDSEIVILELGIGAYNKTSEGGSGLKMWYDYFPKANIVGIDLHDKSFLDNDRTKTFIISQDNQSQLEEMIKEVGRPTIIIDDASHVSRFTIKSFEILFPLLLPGGIYCAEDLHSSYWNAYEFDGDPDPANYTTKTAINYFKWLVDDIHKEYIPDHQFDHEWKGDIESVHFYPKQAFVLKK